MKVKIFAGDNVIDLVKAINQWLGDHPAIVFEYITQSQDAGTVEEVGTVFICIWYMEA